MAKCASCNQEVKTGFVLCRECAERVYGEGDCAALLEVRRGIRNTGTPYWWQTDLRRNL